LGIPPGAPKDQIRKGYKKFVLREHPDIGGKDDPASVERFTRITEAYRDIMRADEDKFWLEAFDARVSAIVLERDRRWAKQRWIWAEARRYREAKRAREEAEGAAAAAGSVATAQAQATVAAAPAEGEAQEQGESWGADRLVVGAVLVVGGVVAVFSLALVFTAARGG